jgi:hypothetical protein
VSLEPHARTLVDLLARHGVAATLRDEIVYLPDLDRWANLWNSRPEGGTAVVEVRATTQGRRVLSDTCAAVGTTPDQSRVDGLRAFCQGSFHVLLAAAWGVLERDQVDHEIRRVAGNDWDVFVGPCVLRTGSGVQPLAIPSSLFDDVLRVLERHLQDREVHTVRVFVASVNGSVTVEGIVDDQSDTDLEAVVHEAAWSFPAEGYASARWFLAASLAALRPSGFVERAICG